MSLKGISIESETDDAQKKVSAFVSLPSGSFVSPTKTNCPRFGIVKFASTVPEAEVITDKREILERLASRINWISRLYRVRSTLRFPINLRLLSSFRVLSYGIKLTESL